MVKLVDTLDLDLQQKSCDTWALIVKAIKCTLLIRGNLNEKSNGNPELVEKINLLYECRDFMECT